ncbi:MAG: FecR domain-containing protein, partial [Bdellovibrionales bacterium]|nr:FecR domain-containing protein [Bdellovibrionales bacterium]
MRVLGKAFLLLSIPLYLLLDVGHSQEIQYVEQDAPTVQGEVARLYSAEGNVEVKLVKTSDWKLIQDGVVFREGDVIRVGRNSRAGVLFADGMLLRLSENATVQFESDQNTPVVDVQKGEAHFFSREPKVRP